MSRGRNFAATVLGFAFDLLGSVLGLTSIRRAGDQANLLESLRSRESETIDSFKRCSFEPWLPAWATLVGTRY